MKLSISDLKREKPKEPFIITVDGDVDVHFANPKKLHWTKLAELDENGPTQAIATLIEDADQYRAFRDDSEMDGEALEWVMSEWRKHFGMGEQGNSPSSTGS